MPAERERGTPVCLDAAAPDRFAAGTNIGAAVRLGVTDHRPVGTGAGETAWLPADGCNVVGPAALAIRPRPTPRRPQPRPGTRDERTDREHVRRPTGFPHLVAGTRPRCRNTPARRAFYSCPHTLKVVNAGLPDHSAPDHSAPDQSAQGERHEQDLRCGGGHRHCGCRRRASRPGRSPMGRRRLARWRLVRRRLARCRLAWGMGTGLGRPILGRPGGRRADRECRCARVRRILPPLRVSRVWHIWCVCGVWRLLCPPRLDLVGLALAALLLTDRTENRTARVRMPAPPAGCELHGLRRCAEPVLFVRHRIG